MRRLYLALTLAAASFAGQAQTYPDKPVRLVIPFAAGGGNDIVSRVIGARLQEGFGQPFVIENRPGANGFIGPRAVADAPADGYTLLMGPVGPMSISPAIFSKMPFSPQNDFAPVTMIGTYPLILVVNSGAPYRNVAELVAFAKANPDKANFASTSATFHLVSELFNLRTGAKFIHIPYKSSAAMNAAVMTGEVTIVFTDPPPTLGMLKSGKLRALAVTSRESFAQLPDVPTMAKAGVKDMEANLWMGLFFKAGTASAISQRMRDEVARGLTAPEVRAKLAGLGIEPDGRTPEAFAKFLAEDIAKWTAVAKAANIKAD
ncbi:MAG: tripartite tricarboxylate transporter substrate binding protein [Burkholderiales bacterium]|nr:tripartite tricarboxylate transporter substrate binding protein [Burkholderiales bacterium]